jgi:hypothetical protein
MTQDLSKDSSQDVDSAESSDSGPADALARKVVAALVGQSLVSEDDGESIRADLAAGSLDTAGWKLVLENQLERKARSDERE